MPVAPYMACESSDIRNRCATCAGLGSCLLRLRQYPEPPPLLLRMYCHSCASSGSIPGIAGILIKTCCILLKMDAKDNKTCCMHQIPRSYSHGISCRKMRCSADAPYTGIKTHLHGYCPCKVVLKFVCFMGDILALFWCFFVVLFAKFLHKLYFVCGFISLLWQLPLRRKKPSGNISMRGGGSARSLK